MQIAPPTSPMGLHLSQPITINSTPPNTTGPHPKPTPTFADAAAKAPKARSVWTVVSKKINPHPRQQPQNTPTPTKQPYSIETLSACHTTKTNIIAYAKATFEIQLSDRIKKPQLIIAYQQLAANPKLTPPQTLVAIQQPHQPTGNSCQHPAPHPFMSEWTVRQRLGMEAIDFHHPFNRNPLALVCHIQTSLRQHLAEAEPPLMLVAG